VCPAHALMLIVEGQVGQGPSGPSAGAGGPEPGRRPEATLR
jgi:hypothetical protein